jgi:hypothetical protein
VKHPELPSEFSPLNRPDTDMAASMEELRGSGYVLFALGPVYVYAGIDTDLMRAFGSEEFMKGKPKDTRGMHVFFETPVLGKCDTWNFVLNVMDSESFPWFKQWLHAQQFCNRVSKRFYVVRHWVVPVLDPLALQAKDRPVAEAMDVFTVSGMKGLMRPRGFNAPSKNVKMLNRFIDFEVAPPEEDVQVLGNAALGIVRDM